MESDGTNKLTLNLPQLYSLMKKDASSYEDEFQIQYRHFESVLRLLAFNPAYFDKGFETLVIFIAQTIQFYKKPSDKVEYNIISKFLGNLVILLRNFSTSLHRSTRLACCKALMILRSSNIISNLHIKIDIPPNGSISILDLFFELSRCQDKSLRSFIKHSIINDIRNSNKTSRNEKVNRELQYCMSKELACEHQEMSAKLALDVMTELYKKNVWRNQEVVNRIADSCRSKSTKLLVASLQFFLGVDEEEDSDKDSSDEEDQRRGALANLRQTMEANKWNKSTRKRQKILDRIKKTVRTHENKEKKNANLNFSALYLINDPQDMAEQLLSLLERANEKFDIKLMIMNLISRLIGIHELVVINFYPFIARYIRPHQMDVTRILQYAAQSSHMTVPPNELEPIMKAIVDNFVSERNSTEAITVGLNALRELCARNPHIMNEDTLQDLVQYQKYKNKNVSIAARSLTNLFRVKNPELLRKRDRGRPIEEAAVFVAPKFGEVRPYTESSDVEMKTESASDEDDDGKSESDQGSSEVEDDDKPAKISDKVSLADIERIYKNPKNNKESRLATVLEGRQDRPKYGRKETNPNKKPKNKRTKAFGMIKHKMRRHKKTKSFQEKQLQAKQKSLNAKKRK